MKKILIATVVGASVLGLVACANQATDENQPSLVEQNNDYVTKIIDPKVINQLLKDENTPVLGDQDAKEAVIVFFDYNCANCAEISKEITKLIDKNPNVKFVFKAYPSQSRDSDVANYASLVAYQAYLQGGPELFEKYNTFIFDQRRVNGQTTVDEVDGIADKLGIKFDKSKLSTQAKNEELESRQLGKEIGLKGPHSFIILPTKLVGMDKDELAKNKAEIHVLSGDHTRGGLQSPEQVANWAAKEVQNRINQAEL